MLLNLGNNRFHRGRVEEVLLRVIVGGSGHHHKVRIPVRQRHIRGGSQVKGPCFKVILNLHVHHRGFLVINQVHLVLVNVQCHHPVVLCQKNRVGKPYIASSHNGNVHLCAPSPILPDFPEWGKIGRLALPPPTHDTLGQDMCGTLCGLRCKFAEN